MFTTDWSETPTADETQRFARLAERLLAIKQGRDQRLQERGRALHRQAAAGVRGTFTVAATLPIPAALRPGPFQPGARYEAFVRFSSGSWERAQKEVPDIRGLAIKLLGLPGPKLLGEASSQDFLLNHTPGLSVKTAEEFIALVESFAAGQLGAPFRLIGAVGFGRALSILKGAAAGLNTPFASFAESAYWSIVPYRFGPTAARFSLAPENPTGPRRGSLKDDLEARLREGLRWTFRVQLYQDPQRTPIEDATVDWEAPWHPIATLEIPPTDLASPEARAVADEVERLSFDPWHAVEELRPLGHINRARKVLYYTASAAQRDAAPEPR